MSFQLLEEFLVLADGSTVGKGGNCEGEVVHVRDHPTPGYPEMQQCQLEEEEEQGDRGTLGGADVDGCRGPWGPLKD